jgi:hypothetical protein
VPYPFGAALLARNGFAPRVDGWLFLSDLREGEVQMEREEDNSFKVSPTPKAMLYSRRHFNLYPLASRCGAMRWATYQTRMAVMIIREASLDGNPLEIQLAFRPGVTPKFWSLRDGRIVPVEPPGVGEVKVY